MRRSSLAFVLLAFLAGGVVGYVLGFGAGVEPASDVQARGNAPEEPAEPSGVEAPPLLPEVHSSAERWIAAISATKVRRGDGVITGTIRTRAGRPLAGVEIRAKAKPEPWPPGRPPPEWLIDQQTDEDLLKYLRMVVRGHRRRRAEQRDARSGADGTFRLTGLADCSYYVETALDGYRIEARRADPSPAPPGSTLAFTAAPVIVTNVVVLLPDGSRPETARLRLEGRRDRPVSRGWKPSRSEIVLTPGRWTLVAEAGLHKEFRSDPVEFEVAEGRPAPEVVLRCRARRGIRGKVVMPELERRTWRKIAAVRIAPGTKADPSRLQKPDRTADSFASREEYVLLDLEPGTWLVGLLMDVTRVVVHMTVEVGDGLSTADLVVTPPDPSEYVDLTVLGPGGEPLERVEFRSRYVVETGRSSGPTRAQKIGPGRWRVWHHSKPTRYAEGGRYGIRASTRELGEKWIWYAREPALRLTIRFDRPAMLTATVQGYVGSGLEGALVLRLAPAGERVSSFPGNSKISAEGVQRLGPVQPGDYRLGVIVGRSIHDREVEETSEISLKSGENNCTILAPKPQDRPSPR